MVSHSLMGLKESQHLVTVKVYFYILESFWMPSQQRQSTEGIVIFTVSIRKENIQYFNKYIKCAYAQGVYW